MYKTCINCEKTYKTKDSRQQSCSKSCADVRRVQNAWKPDGKELSGTTWTVPSVMDVARPMSREVLPPPEELPAPYAKRVYDMWSALIGDAPTRIA